MNDVDFIKLVIILIVAYLVMKLVGLAFRIIIKLLIFIGVLYLIFHYLTTHG
ncbi:hypothetical protein [Sulfurihydrogenibium sp.]|jgi:hypothetical protein|uniref:hypothetical protein n=1 Tax=Sulfurihydrogenibium sp. TaxID=2053621 RepID=UPI002630C26F|nr:hypothetical protein [Sulfurihydrogenibium sp.]